MRKVVKVIKKLFGTPVVLNLVENPFLYKDNPKSFCGGTLDQESVLVVTNLDKDLQLNKIEHLLNVERCIYTIETDIKLEKLRNNTDIGPYMHIINIIKCDKTKECVQSIYQLIQKEANYLVNKVHCASICTIVISKDHIGRMTLSNLLKGLGKALGNHGIINNGVVAENDQNLEAAIRCAIYLSSKFGQIMAGEVLEMRE